MTDIAPSWVKEDATCCAALIDDHGRLPLGYCSPDCVRRAWPPVASPFVTVPLHETRPLLEVLR